MPRRATGADHDPLGGRQLRQHIVEAAELDAALARAHAPAHGVGHRLRLLHDLLEHEVLVAPLGDLLEVPVELVDLLRDRRAVDLEHLVAVGPHDGHLAVGEIDDLLGELDERARVGADEVLALADAQQQRAAVARDHQQVGLVEAQRHDAVGALDARERLADGLGEGEVGLLLDLLDELGQHLGVGVALEGVALPDELLLDGGVVLDDAVVDDREATVTRRMRVRVEVARRAVGRPAGVPHADGALDGAAVEQLGQFVDLALLLADLERAVQDGDARGVVAAVFEPPKAADEEVAGLTRTDVTDDATHRRGELKKGGDGVAPHAGRHEHGRTYARGGRFVPERPRTTGPSKQARPARAQARRRGASARPPRRPGGPGP